MVAPAGLFAAVAFQVDPRGDGAGDHVAAAVAGLRFGLFGGDGATDFVAERFEAQGGGDLDVLAVGRLGGAVGLDAEPVAEDFRGFGAEDGQPVGRVVGEDVARCRFGTADRGFRRFRVDEEADRVAAGFAVELDAEPAVAGLEPHGAADADAEFCPGHRQAFDFDAFRDFDGQRRTGDRAVDAHAGAVFDPCFGFAPTGTVAVDFDGFFNRRQLGGGSNRVSGLAVERRRELDQARFARVVQLFDRGPQRAGFDRGFAAFFADFFVFLVPNAVDGVGECRCDGGQGQCERKREQSRDNDSGPTPASLAKLEHPE